MVAPRMKNITSFIQRNELKKMVPDSAVKLPERIYENIGELYNITFPQQGMCSIVSIIHSSKGEFLLKTAKGAYRGEELHMEYAAMEALKKTNIPIPAVYDFFKEGDFYYLIRECKEGIPLNTIFNESNDKGQRLYMIKEMAKTLSDIHKLKVSNWSFSEFIEGQLFFAEQHFRNNTIDLEEFVFDGEFIEPETLLNWLKDNKPTDGKVTLIHGDYRPKNILWHKKGIEAVVDWAFCDIGDPYYDFAIFKDYLNNDEERMIFLQNYGIDSFDKGRLNYYDRMMRFINI